MGLPRTSRSYGREVSRWTTAGGSGRTWRGYFPFAGRSRARPAAERALGGCHPIEHIRLKLDSSSGCLFCPWPTI